MKNNIIFYMVPASPWSFLSFSRIEEILNTHNIEVDTIPVDIFKLFEAHGIKMVSQRPIAIQKNRLTELKRWKNYLKINFNIKPKFFPVNPIKSCKLIIACSILHSKEKMKTFKLAKSLSEAVWINDLNIDNDEVLFKIADEVIDSNDLRKIYIEEKVEKILKNNTKTAIQKNIFGVPTFVFNNQNFWGQDRIFFLEKEIINSNA